MRRPERKGGLAAASRLCGGGWRSGDRAPRFEKNLRKDVPGRRRGTGADPVAAGPCIGTDDRTLPRDEAGSRSRAERRNQA